MRDRLVKKGLVIGIILLFVGANFIPIVVSLKNEKDNISELSFSDWDYEPTIIVPDNYTTIQEAVYAAGPGDIIGVRANHYKENVIIDDKKDLIICGALESPTIIDGNQSDNTLLIEDSENIIVTGFFITGAKIEEYYAGIKIIQSSFAYINKNNITNNAIGILTMNNSYNLNISQNYIAHNILDKINHKYGIGISIIDYVPSLGSDYLDYGIWSNIIIFNNIGVHVWHATGGEMKGLFIGKNKIMNNDVAGINVEMTPFIGILWNRISQNEVGISGVFSFLNIATNDILDNNYSLFFSRALFVAVYNNIDGTSLILLECDGAIGLAPMNWWGTKELPRRRVAPWYAIVLLRPYVREPWDLPTPQ